MQTPERSELLPLLADLSPAQFETTALSVFRYQAKANPFYAKYLKLLGRNPETIDRLSDIPFLPIQFFKKQEIQSGDWTPETIFLSSSTTGQTPSQHLVRSVDWYLQNTRRGFGQFYGDPSEWCVLALLPSYLERTGSSLVAMADYFIHLSKYSESGFFLNDLQQLSHTLVRCRLHGYKTLLLGVSFGLLDFAEQFPMDLSGVTIMETGGMKGRRKELTRSELHQELRQAFHVQHIHSEYGMTELLSQAYAMEGEVFAPMATMRIQTTEINDPFCITRPGKTGVLNVIDLANLDTCSFIQTEDVGRVYEDGRFEVLGRLDVAEMRGCNLMVE
ncbi:MAG: acyl transferase [Bacteroidetes bacterium]|nr:acyl transferase [Bacteroidota bacterium]